MNQDDEISFERICKVFQNLTSQTRFRFQRPLKTKNEREIGYLTGLAWSFDSEMERLGRLIHNRNAERRQPDSEECDFRKFCEDCLSECFYVQFPEIIYETQIALRAGLLLVAEVDSLIIPAEPYIKPELENFFSQLTRIMNREEIYPDEIFDTKHEFGEKIGNLDNRIVRQLVIFYDEVRSAFSEITDLNESDVSRLCINSPHSDYLIFYRVKERTEVCLEIIKYLYSRAIVSQIPDYELGSDTLQDVREGMYHINPDWSLVIPDREEE